MALVGVMRERAECGEWEEEALGTLLNLQRKAVGAKPRSRDGNASQRRSRPTRTKRGQKGRAVVVTTTQMQRRGFRTGAAVDSCERELWSWVSCARSGL